MPKQSSSAALRAQPGYAAESESCSNKNVGEIERIMSVAAGALLGLNGLTTLSRSPFKAVLELSAGAALAYRGVSGWCSLYSALGVNHASDSDSAAVLSSGEGVRVEKSITIDQPVAEVYAFWRRLENLPKVMQHLKSVVETDAKRSRWVAAGPLGTEFEWDAEIIEERPNEFISWKSGEGSTVAVAGSVHFEATGDGAATQVHVLLRYLPPAGSLGNAVAEFLGDAPERQIEHDLDEYAAGNSQQSNAHD